MSHDKVLLKSTDTLLCFTNEPFIGRRFVKRFALCHQTVVCLSVTLVYCGQRVGRIEMKLCMQVGLGPAHIVLDADQLTLPQKGA